MFDARDEARNEIWGNLARELQEMRQSLHNGQSFSYSHYSFLWTALDYFLSFSIPKIPFLSLESAESY